MGTPDSWPGGVVSAREPKGLGLRRNWCFDWMPWEQLNEPFGLGAGTTLCDVRAGTGYWSYVRSRHWLCRELNCNQKEEHVVGRHTMRAAASTMLLRGPLVGDLCPMI